MKLCHFWLTKKNDDYRVVCGANFRGTDDTAHYAQYVRPRDVLYKDYDQLCEACVLLYFAESQVE